VVRADRRLLLRFGEAVTAAEQVKPALELALGRRLGAERSPERCRLPAWIAGDGRLELIEVEDPQRLCPIDERRQLSRVQDLGEVEDRAGDSGHPDAVDGRDVLRIQPACPVDDDAGSRVWA
jgi:hypothetical protein